MKKIKIAAGIFWAFLCLILILILFPQLNTFSSGVSRLPFMKINPNFTGGEIAERIVMESCTLVVRKPVFDGLIGERRHGFVQVDWRGGLPDIISDSIDYNSDRKADFIIKIDRKNNSTELMPLDPHVLSAGISTPTSYGWCLRVNLKK
jgi:hypothetical protein